MLLSTSIPSEQYIHHDIKQLLSKFQAEISLPNSLPPKRECDHKIPLLHGSKPMSLKPYRNSFHIKNELENLIREILDSRIIRKSTSAFTAPCCYGKEKRWIMETLYRL